MGIINQLDFGVANLIAAGEVVDRPASVIKELLENAIDAGADEITVEIKRGGITFMRVTDNGKGIEREDLPIAIKRHATSKISNAGDLDSIMTLGFRGEALAAIAAVSKLRIMSKTEGSDVGYILESVSGELKNISEAGCPNGTTVIVEQLFANVPARLKFLKKDLTEAMAVCAYVEKIALSRPDISIRLIIDGNMKFMTTGDNKLYNIIYILLGRDFAKKLIEVDNNADGVHVYGYIGTPENVRANRNFQNFFINKRYVKSKTVAASLEQAYSTFIPTDKFPCAFLNIEINPSLVDVNVHPAKLEVKFSNEKLVFDTVYATVKQALENKISRPEFNINPTGVRFSADDYMKKLNAFVPVNDGRMEVHEQIDFSSLPVYELKLSEAPKRAEEKIEAQKAIQNELNAQGAKAVQKEEISDENGPVKTAPFDEPFVSKSLATKTSKPLSESVCEPRRTTVDDEPFMPDYRIIGEAFFSYVFVEIGERVLIIDKHAAHERIIFEELKENLQNRKCVAQILLVPIDVVMSGAEIGAISEYVSEIKSTGFEFKIYGNTVSITEIPSQIGEDSVVMLFETMAGRLADGTGSVGVSRDIVYERALFQASCKAAVKIGHIHDSEHIKWIVERVIALDIIKYCPHGRPVAFELTKHDFERQFKRV